MPHLATVSLAALLLEGDDLPPPADLDDAGLHDGAVDGGTADENVLVGGHQANLVDGDLVAAELQALVRTPTETDIAQAPDGLLIEHIVTRYHDVHRQQLPELIRLAARLERVHGGHPECPVGLTRHLEEMQRELAIHMDKEERILFPMIFRGMGAAALEPIAIMRREHDDHGESLAQLKRVTHGMIEPPDACTTWRALYSGLRTLRTDLMDHIHLENNVLFHRFDA